MPTMLAPKARVRTLGLGLLSLLVLAACGDGSDVADPPIDENSFIQMALQSSCADVRNKLYVIDEMLVLSDRAGNCADAAYSQVLYGTKVNDRYCRHEDSIAGPQKECRVAAYQEMFDTMIANLDAADLGLGTAHGIRVLLQ